MDCDWRNKSNPRRGASPLGCKIFIGKKKWPYSTLVFLEVLKQALQFILGTLWRPMSTWPCDITRIFVDFNKELTQQQMENHCLHECLFEIAFNLGSSIRLWNGLHLGNTRSWKHKWIWVNVGILWKKGKWVDCKHLY